MIHLFVLRTSVLKCGKAPSKSFGCVGEFTAMVSVLWFRIRMCLNYSGAVKENLVQKTHEFRLPNREKRMI